MRSLNCVREESSWYIDLPEWNGPKADLLMVCGADTLLDTLAGEENVISFDADLKFFNGASPINLLREGINEGGGYYSVKELAGKQINREIWL